MDIDLVRNTLDPLRELERSASTPEQHHALQFARLLLYFILGRGESGSFAEYLENFNTPRRTPALSFATREEAESWLRTHPAPPHGVTLGAAGTRYILAYAREPDHRKLLPLPSEEEVANLEEEEDEAEEFIEEEASPPDPSQASRFSLTRFLEWTAFHLHALHKRVSAPESIEAIRAAKIAFHFVMEGGEEHGFEEYRHTFHSAKAAAPAHSFATQQAADGWLAKQPEPPPPVVVAIGSELYSVGYDRLKRLRLLIRLPTQQELDCKDPLLHRPHLKPAT